MRLCRLHKDVKATLHRCQIGFARAILVGIKAQHIHDVVARIALEVLLLRRRLGARTVSPKQVGQATRLHEVVGHAPQPFVLLGGANILSPPEPAARVLVPRAEQHRHRRSVGSLDGSKEVSHTPHARQELLVQLSVRQDGSRRSLVVEIPCIASRQRIVQVPRECHDAPTLIVGNNLTPHLVEEHAVEVSLVPQFQTPEVEADDSRIVATDLLRV